MMALLNITIAKMSTATVELEESIAKQVDLYAAYVKAPADKVVNEALNYVFSEDKEFQKFCEKNPAAKAQEGLRVKKTDGAMPGAKRGRKPVIGSAN